MPPGTGYTSGYTRRTITTECHHTHTWQHGFHYLWTAVGAVASLFQTYLQGDPSGQGLVAILDHVISVPPFSPLLRLGCFPRHVCILGQEFSHGTMIKSQDTHLDTLYQLQPSWADFHIPKGKMNRFLSHSQELAMS